MNVTLVTGSSSGIGLHLATEFAKHGHSLVLVAPHETELRTVAAQISGEHGTVVLPIAADLQHPDAPEKIAEQLRREGMSVNILANNAGLGHRGKSWEIGIDLTLDMVRLNIEAVLRLTHLLLPPMLERGEGRILNTASVAGFEPGPLLNVYHATKAFLLSWSEGLAVELEGTGVSVTALCPGPTDTDFFIKAGMEDTRAFQEAKVMAPQDVATAGYRGVMDRELIVVPGWTNKALVAARRVLTERAQAKFNQKLYEEVPASEQSHRRGDWEEAAAPDK